MSPRKGAGRDRRLKWGDGWVTAKTTAKGETRYLANWRERQPDGSCRTRARQFATEAQAEAHLRDVADKQARGAYVPPERLTVDQLVTAFLDRAASRLAPSTLGQWRARHRAMISPVLGNVRLTDLTTSRVQHWIDGLVRRGLGPETVVGARRVLFGACKEGAILGILAANPVIGTKPPAIPRKAMTVWSDGEVRRVLAVVAADPLLDAAYRLSLSTGLRPGELLALRWADVDLARGVLTVRRTRTTDEHLREAEHEQTKGRRTRAIALMPSAVAALKSWKRAQAEIRLAAVSWRDADHVLTDEKGRRITRERWAGYQDLVVVMADVPRLTPHGCRHSYATLELAAGTHPKIVQERLGHASIAITLDRYSHVDLAMQRRAAEALERSLFGDESYRSGTTTCDRERGG